MYGRLGHDISVESVTEIDGINVITVAKIIISMIASKQYNTP